MFAAYLSRLSFPFTPPPSLDKMEATASQLPESYDFSQSQFTQTQPQTQPDTQPTPSSTSFPSHLWGILLSSSGESSSTSASATGLVGGVGSIGELDRPTRFEFWRSTSGGKGVYTIGRHPKSDVRLNSPKVSNNHARISISSQDGLVRLEDLSTNGTFVRGVKVRFSLSVTSSKDVGFERENRGIR